MVDIREGNEQCKLHSRRNTGAKRAGQGDIPKEKHLNRVQIDAKESKIQFQGRTGPDKQSGLGRGWGRPSWSSSSVRINACTAASCGFALAGPHFSTGGKLSVCPPL